MTPVKIIFFDIDGTLIDFKGKPLSPKTREALLRLREKGILLCIATGRSPMALPKFEGVTFDAWLVFNGSLCYTPEHTIFRNPIPAEDVQKLINNATALGRPVSVATAQRLAANGSDVDLSDYYAIGNLQLEVAEDFEEVARQDVFQVMMGCREQDYPAILQGVDGAKIAAWWDRAADIIPANGGKGAGIQAMLNYYGLTKAEALAFGDGNNDIEMLQAVGTGVAMGNASDKLKSIADDVCGHVAEDGIYHYCLEHGLI